MNMSSLYYALDWLVLLNDLPGNVLMGVNNLCRELNIGIAANSEKTQEGYYVVHFVIQVPSSETLNEFVAKAEKYMEFKNIRESDADHFKGGPLIPAWHVLEFATALQKTSDYNRRLLEKTTRDTDRKRPLAYIAWGILL